MSDDPRKVLNAAAFLNLLRELNPHLPPSHLITQDTITLTFGAQELSVLNLSVFVELPDAKRIEAMTADTCSHAQCEWIKDEERYDCEVAQ